MKTRRRLLAVAALLLGASSILDPYTWFRDASDFVLPAPVWQTVLGLANTMIIIAAVVFLWRKRYGAACAGLVFEFTFNVAANLMYLHRDGLQRFSHGFAGEQYLSLYLVVLLLRVWIIAGIAQMRTRERSH